jgi:EAL domain-containing protein (putative c-di-GMP-specific phosphodiesterase class I)
VHADGGERASPWSVFAQAADDAELVTLDRLCRTVHALNYFPAASSEAVLFLNVEQRLLTGVSADHGAYFESILALLGIAPGRVTIVMPPTAQDNPVAFVRAAISYRIRGYRVLAQVRSLSETDLGHVFMADPHYVAIDAPLPDAAQLTPFVESLARRRIQAVMRRVETVEQAGAARRAGIELLQGRLFGETQEGAA